MAVLELLEVGEAITRLKNFQAAGSDGVLPELLRCDKVSILRSLHTLLLVACNEGEVPVE